MEDKKSIGTVIEYLDKIGGIDESTGLTPEKVMERGEMLSDDSDFPDCIIFRVERHRGMFGSSYSPGCPMLAFLTYWPIYSFNIKTENLTQIEESSKPSEITIDYSLATETAMEMSFNFSSITDGKYECVEMLSRKQSVISNIKDVEKFASDCAKNIYLDYLKDDLKEFYNDEQAQDLVNKIREAIEEKLISKALEDWEEFQNELEEEC